VTEEISAAVTCTETQQKTRTPLRPRPPPPPPPSVPPTYRYRIEPVLISFSSFFLGPPPAHEASGLPQLRAHTAAASPFQAVEIPPGHRRPFPEQVHLPVARDERRVVEAAGGGNDLNPADAAPAAAPADAAFADPASDPYVTGDYPREGRRGKGGDLAWDGPAARKCAAGAGAGHLSLAGERDEGLLLPRFVPGGEGVGAGVRVGDGDGSS